MLWYDYFGLFVMLYPGAMAVYWTLTALLYFFVWENREEAEDFGFGADAPPVSVLIPCFNEAENLRTSIPHLLNMDYPRYELIFIDDGSSDDTLRVLENWAAENARIRVVGQGNRGKAAALNHGLRYARGKYIVCIDGDAVLDYSALSYFVQTMEDDDGLAGLTGNPRVRNRSTVLGRLQVAEFSSIIGLIKRSQSVSGMLFTLSGVILCLRRSVLRQLGGWSENMMTEDIDITWKAQTAGLRVAYEPRALCWVLMPETLGGLYRQRLRWAQGGAEVMMKYFPAMWQRKNLRLWPLYLEYLITLMWVCALAGMLLSALWRLPEAGGLPPLPGLETSAAVTFMLFLFQFSASLFIDSRYESRLYRYFLSCIWYPYAFWLITGITLLHGLPRAVFRDRSRQATWVSPDRGVQ
ncbi:MAG: poly-beta-1,6-N-acetyl-D-glucosamine synthase [Neisseria sp.]|nr:poly-beta-1,6-N-acetyl-D-glucosamine synthase [Neisseria sp.]